MFEQDLLFRMGQLVHGDFVSESVLARKIVRLIAASFRCPKFMPLIPFTSTDDCC